MAIISKKTGKLICGAKTKAGTPCERSPMKNGSGRCSRHGGKSPKGIASPHFKTGRYSKYLPGRLMERFNESQSDKELLALRSEISLLDARIEDILRRVDTGEAGAAWNDAKRQYLELRKAMNDQDITGISNALRGMGDILNGGAGDYAAWGEIQSAFELRRRLVESERKRLIEMNQVITAEQAMLLITTVLDVIRRNVHDKHVLSTIQDEFARIFAIQTVNRPGEPAGSEDII